MSSSRIIQYVILAAFIAVFAIHAVSFSFTQDDAFISYRYVKNFLNGDGLVYNPGERVEGYTNLFLIILLAFLGRLNIDIIIASKIIGIISGAFVILLSFIWSRKIPGGEKSLFLPLGVPFLLITNSILAYWAISGLETFLFAALVLLGVYLASHKNPLFVAILALAALTRPEGGLIFILILIYMFFQRQLIIKTAFYYLIAFVLLIAPQFLFRLYYYHDILPNSFYAKTGFSAEYILSGVHYVWLFLKEYALLGGLFVLPLVVLRHIKQELGPALFVVYGFSLYIMLIGGDVLHCHRFFLPIVPMLYMAFVFSLFQIGHIVFATDSKIRNLLVFSIIIITGVLTFWLPLETINNFLPAEKGLVNKMSHHALVLKPYFDANRRVACTTIGAFGYYSDAVVIDMLGLTDRTIARNPKGFDRIKSTWKERNYNIPYIMNLEPDFIVFSTGLKPSAPAEKALFLSSKFRHGYYPVFDEKSGLQVIYKKKEELPEMDEYFPDPAFIDFFIDAINYKSRGDYEQAYLAGIQCLQSAPADFYLPLSILGKIQLEIGLTEDGVEILKEALNISDGYATLSGKYLMNYYESIGDSTQAMEIFRQLQRINRLE